MTDFFIKLDDTSPGIEYQLSPATVDLTGATATFSMYDLNGNTVIDAQPAIVQDVANRILRYAFSASDTDVVGDFRGEFRVTYSDSTIETFPNSGFIAITVFGRQGYAVSNADVTNGFSTSASATDVANYIALMSDADACLANNNVSNAVGVQLKVLGVRHLLANSSDRGAVLSERAVSGAARTYQERRQGETGYLQTLRSIDRYGCVLNLISKNQGVQLRSVGRRC